MAKPRPRISAQARREMLEKKERKNRISRWLELAALLVLLIGLGISVQQWYSNHKTNQQAAKLVYQANHDINHSVPSTNKPVPSALDSYTVGPTLPRYILIPKLGVKAIVRPLGLTAAGALEAPDNIYDTGWFNGSAKPGQPGVTVIDGHVSSWTAKGVFHDLVTLKIGDQIQIQRGDGALINYQISKSQTYTNTAVDMNAVLNPINPKKSGLNLITCTGEVIKGTNEFNKRVVVFAQQI